MFVYQRNIHVYETDLMGIVHHSNYLRFCEEARVALSDEWGLLDTSNESVFALTVLETQVRHLWPARYGDHLDIEVQVRVNRVKIEFEYRIKNKNSDKVLALAKTTHCSLDEDFKVKRVDQKIINKLAEKTKWIETWL